jgi:hypothetical protein
MAQADDFMDRIHAQYAQKFEAAVGVLEPRAQLVARAIAAWFNTKPETWRVDDWSDPTDTAALAVFISAALAKAEGPTESEQLTDLARESFNRTTGQT